MNQPFLLRLSGVTTMLLALTATATAHGDEENPNHTPNNWTVSASIASGIDVDPIEQEATWDFHPGLVGLRVGNKNVITELYAGRENESQMCAADHYPGDFAGVWTSNKVIRCSGHTTRTGLRFGPSFGKQDSKWSWAILGGIGFHWTNSRALVTTTHGSDYRETTTQETREWPRYADDIELTLFTNVDYEIIPRLAIGTDLEAVVRENRYYSDDWFGFGYHRWPEISAFQLALHFRLSYKIAAF